VTDQRSERPDARCCPDCGARGILPLDQPHDMGGGITDPLMLCPTCEKEFCAVGFTFGAVKPPSDWSSICEEEKHEAMSAMAQSILRQLFADSGG